FYAISALAQAGVMLTHLFVERDKCVSGLLGVFLSCRLVLIELLQAGETTVQSVIPLLIGVNYLPIHLC
ncbi:MAG: hypothetical protein ACLVKA_10135, partial [Collinsella aerofaciens]